VKPAALLLVCALAPGCGDDGADNVQFLTQCTAPAPCGGDPTGRWRVASGCVQLPPALAGCSGPILGGHGSLAGTLTLQGGSFSTDVHSRLAPLIETPPACGACTQVETMLRATWGSLSCSDDGAGCRCSADESTHETESGTYTMAGTTLTLGGAATYSYCVQGTTLWLVASTGLAEVFVTRLDR
jgi:hypothetical protein